jgi:hypothetical protein
MRYLFIYKKEEKTFMFFEILAKINFLCIILHHEQNAHNNEDYHTH